MYGSVPLRQLEACKSHLRASSKLREAAAGNSKPAVAAGGAAVDTTAPHRSHVRYTDGLLESKNFCAAPQA